MSHIPTPKSSTVAIPSLFLPEASLLPTTNYAAPPPPPLTHNSITQAAPLTQLVLESKTLDVCFMDPVMINQFAFQSWLQGESIDETAKLYNRRRLQQVSQVVSGSSASPMMSSTSALSSPMSSNTARKQSNGADFATISENINNPTQKMIHELLYVEIVSQYRIFDHIEKTLSQPNLFMKQDSCCEVQLAPSIRRKLIEQYFELDDCVLRELLGKKLTQKVRKDLDDVSEKTGVKIVSCRRQFDNLRNVAQYLKTALFQMPTHREMTMNGESKSLNGGSTTTAMTTTSNNDSSMSNTTSFDDLVNIMRSHFLLSEELAKKYALVLFMGHHRFDCHRRKMKDFSYQDFESFCTHMVYHWTNTRHYIRQHNTKNVLSALSLMNLDFDFYVLRDIKQTVYGHKNRLSEYEAGVIRELKQTNSISVEQLSRLEEKFSQLFKSLLVIGAGLVQTKEVRDFFIDLHEKFVDVLVRQIGLSKHEVLRFCDALITQLDSVKTSHKAKLTKLWTTYIVTVRNISAGMFDACSEK